jgi:hypothetical protein
MQLSYLKRAQQAHLYNMCRPMKVRTQQRITTRGTEDYTRIFNVYSKFPFTARHLAGISRIFTEAPK